MDFQKTTKTTLFENVHHSRVPGPVWPKRVADRTPITTVGCVFRRGLKSGPREPKERKSAPARFLKALNKLGQKTEVHQTLCSTMRNCFRTQNGGPYFSKNDAPLQRKGPFGNLEKRGAAQSIPTFLVPPPPEPPTTFTAAVGTPCAGALPVTWESWEREAR